MEFFVLIGCVALLMYGMKVMSEGLQKMAGAKLRKVLATMTTNRFTSLLTGAFITASVQSSTATTVMTVSFVSAGLLTLSQAISVIMGANIGTTLTAWIMVLGGAFDMRSVVYTAIVISIILIYSKRNINLGEFIMGLALMLLGLTTLKSNAVEMHLDQNPVIQNFFASISGWGYGSYLLFLFIGGMLTCAVQSSAAIMAITMTLCSTGVLDIYMGIALVMGENIGTTITSNIVALSASTQARRAAMAHLIFNLFGVCWILCIFPYFVDFVCELVGCNPHEDIADKNILNAVLAAFHTAFNVCNVLILIWFVPLLEKAVCFIIPNKQGADEEESRLLYISGGLLSTAELSIFEAKKELNVFIARCVRMYGFAEELLHTDKGEDFNKLFSRIEKYENITDNMEIEICDYLTKVSEGRLSAESKVEIQRMMRMCGELESIGDSIYQMAILKKNQREQGIALDQECRNNLDAMYQLVGKSLEVMDFNLHQPYDKIDLTEAYAVEKQINNLRDKLRNHHLESIKAGAYTYQVGTTYSGMYALYEKTGDYVINVSEALRVDQSQKVVEHNMAPQK